MLDFIGYRFQIDMGVIKISQEDMVILGGEKFGGIYMLREWNSDKYRASSDEVKEACIKMDRIGEHMYLEIIQGSTIKRGKCQGSRLR